MEEFMRKFLQLNNKNAKILLEHCLFDKQMHYCENMQIINDDKIIGIILKNQEIFVSKQDIKLAKAYDNMFILSDGRLQMTIIVSKV